MPSILHESVLTSQDDFNDWSKLMIQTSTANKQESVEMQKAIDRFMKDADDRNSSIKKINVEELISGPDGNMQSSLSNPEVAKPLHVAKRIPLEEYTDDDFTKTEVDESVNTKIFKYDEDNVKVVEYQGMRFYEPVKKIKIVKKEKE